MRGPVSAQPQCDPAAESRRMVAGAEAGSPVSSWEASGWSRHVAVVTERQERRGRAERHEPEGPVSRFQSEVRRGRKWAGPGGRGGASEGEPGALGRGGSGGGKPTLQCKPVFGVGIQQSSPVG